MRRRRPREASIVSSTRRVAIGLLAAFLLAGGVTVAVRAGHHDTLATIPAVAPTTSGRPAQTGTHVATPAPPAKRSACGLQVPPAERPEPSVALQTSASINPTSATDFASCGFQHSVLNLRSEGANEVTLVVPYEQDSRTTSVIHAEPITPTTASLITAIHFVRSLGMRVMLSFHDDMANGSWRAFINASDRATWFARYGAILDSLGRIAQTNGAAEICLGTELYDMTSTDANPANGPAWLTMIRNLRKIYTGDLTYAGQRPGAYENETTSLSFWPEMSQIGVDAYYPLGNTCDPSVASMIDDWQRIDAKYLQPLARKYHKPIFFAELGFSSVNCDNLNPAYYGHGGFYAGDNRYDGTGQANLFEALFQHFSTDPDFAGISVWFWYADPTASYPGDLSFSTYRKPAALVLSHWFMRLDGRVSKTS